MRQLMKHSKRYISCRITQKHDERPNAMGLSVAKATKKNNETNFDIIRGKTTAKDSVSDFL